LQVNGIALSQNSNGFTLTVTGQGIAATQVQLFNLAGSLVLNAEAQGNALQFQLNGPGGALANGVYLYVVTVKGYDGTVIKSEVRKLVILR
ncbi:MAG: T9SS type A sorting domain-containing protein, partial [Candidatus Zipacnadales bacterium]